MVDVLEIRDGVELRSQRLKLRVQSWGENSLRVRATVLSDIDDKLDWARARGSQIMVAPVLEAGKRSRSLYLPGGARWREGDTGEVHRGGVWIEVDAPLDRVPYFYRE